MVQHLHPANEARAESKFAQDSPEVAPLDRIKSFQRQEATTSGLSPPALERCVRRRLMLLSVPLPGMNPNWSGWTSAMISVQSPANTLANSLASTLMSEIGLYEEH